MLHDSLREALFLLKSVSCSGSRSTKLPVECAHSEKSLHVCVKSSVSAANYLVHYDAENKHILISAPLGLFCISYAEKPEGSQNGRLNLYRFSRTSKQKGAPCCVAHVTGNFRCHRGDKFMAIKCLDMDISSAQIFHKT